MEGSRASPGTPASPLSIASCRVAPSITTAERSHVPPMTARLAVGILAAAAASPATAAVTGTRPECGQAHTSGERRVSLASMRSRVPLYLMEASGRLVKMDLQTGERITLSDHAVERPRALHPSADGRWLSYRGETKAGNKTQYWLYDRRKHREWLIYEHPPYGSAIPSFSPDSRYVVMSAWYDSRWPDASRAGIYLFDTSALRLHPVPLPVVKTNRALAVSAAWSQDGKELLIMVRTKWTKEGFDYFSYDLATRRIEAIRGRYNAQAIRHEFWRGGQRIPTFEEIAPRSARGGRSEWSPGRSWRAHIDEREGRSGLPSPRDQRGRGDRAGRRRLSWTHRRPPVVHQWLARRPPSGLSRLDELFYFRRADRHDR